MKDKIIVVGSLNVDMVIKTSHIPQPGETVLGGSFLMNPGGKGANQAVTVARLGGDVSFVGKIGDDIFGKQSLALFKEEGVDISCLLSDHNTTSGIALITVDDKGENCIVVAPGANAHLHPKDIEFSFGRLQDAKILLVQLEIPLHTVEHAVKMAHKKGMIVMLNPAPANKMVTEIFHLIDIITPNENEAALLSGVAITDIPSAKKAAEKIYEQGVKNVVITLGKKGAVLLEQGAFSHIEAPKVETVDTTAAGDVFNGALAVAVAEGKLLTDAVAFACRAASLAVTRMGAQSSIPYRKEILLSILT